MIVPPRCHYDTSRPSWLLEGTLRYFLIADPLACGYAHNPGVFPQHTSYNKAINLLRGNSPTFSRYQFCSPAQPVRGFTLGDLLDEPWSQVSSLPSPPYTRPRGAMRSQEVRGVPCPARSSLCPTCDSLLALATRKLPNTITQPMAPKATINIATDPAPERQY